MAVPKNLAVISHREPLTQIAATFPKMASFIHWEINDHHIGFKTAEDLREALDTPLVVNKYIVPTFAAPYRPPVWDRHNTAT